MTTYKTTFYLPESPHALLADTLLVVLDARVLGVSIEQICRYRALSRRDGETDHEYAQRCWSSVFPTRSSNRDAMQMRIDYGWTKPEIEFVIVALEHIRNALLKSSESVPLEGTATTLSRDAKRILDLMWRWRSLLEA